MVGFQTNVAHLIMMTRQCVACRNNVASLKVKVKRCTLVEFLNYLAEIIVKTRDTFLPARVMSLAQMSRSYDAREIYA